MEQYWIWLSSVEGLGPRKFYQLMAEYEDAREVWGQVGKQMAFLGKKVYQNLRDARSEEYLYQLFVTMERMGIRAITRLHDDYPKSLTDIYDPPPVLYVKGDMRLNDQKLFAMVGARTPTFDGKRAAKQIAEGLGKHSVSVVSGFARGVDASAHIGCMDGGSPTVAVLGCGLDTIYPPEHAELYDRIIDEGGAIISEYKPGSPPVGTHFPARNRIISGLCPGVLIVEAAKGSGSVITANTALEQDRDVFVVPGSIYSKLSAETNRLLVEGAMPAISEWEILSYYGWAQKDIKAGQKLTIKLTQDERKIVEPLQSELLSFDELSEKTQISVAKLNSLLTTLELRGIINKVPGSGYRAAANFLID